MSYLCYVGIHVNSNTSVRDLKCGWNNLNKNLNGQFRVETNYFLSDLQLRQSSKYTQYTA